MQAKITKQVQNAKNYDGDKERVNTLKAVGKLPGSDELQTICEARMWMGRSRSSSTVYCSLWVHRGGGTSGRGTAGGGGYHKESQALADAISSAGIELYGDTHTCYDHKTGAIIPEDLTKRAYIGGVGESAMQRAMEAIAVACGATVGPDLTIV